ncbi:hypothetical protein DNK06_05550 [Pseudomonas daroniae]|uniref:Uncharacterized protein n=1 Tax=Phytopseudomonas daroniae TaxID=2487519 RepID=A0A4V2KB20_9GAMM|nr:hypothetical protein DNK06_05550 [Pseudomonas daroniae]TBU92286.1 hypothetical protein DNJ99_07695 [Pseudomonas daroniae]
MPAIRVCSRFDTSRVAAPNGARQGAERREWLPPCQVPQRRLAPFAAQPGGPGQFLRAAALLVVHLE